MSRLITVYRTTVDPSQTLKPPMENLGQVTNPIECHLKIFRDIVYDLFGFDYQEDVDEILDHIHENLENKKYNHRTNVTRFLCDAFDFYDNDDLDHLRWDKFDPQKPWSIYDESTGIVATYYIE